MIKELVICSATASSVSGFIEKPLRKFLNRNEYNYLVEYDNKFGLPKVYNNFINESYKEADPILLFCHDDVEIQDDNLYEKLKDGLKQFDIIGLAGTQIFNMKKPILWHVNDKSKFSGAVAHSHDNNVFMTSFGPFKRRCIVVDGMFIAVRQSTLLNNDLQFDERFNFHHYDIDFCLSAHNKGLKIGTWPIWVVHNSIGVWDKPEWHESEKLFCEKYKIF